jgi:mono/diheme cytochrome c family protein
MLGSKLRRARSKAALFGAGALLSCGSNAAAPESTAPSNVPGSSNVGAPNGPSGLPCDVDAIFRANCQTCHGPSPAGGAPMSLVTHDDLLRDLDGKKVYELVKERIHAEGESVMPPRPGKLSADALATLDTWIQAGAPPSTDTCTNRPNVPDAIQPLNCKPDLVLKSSAPFTMPAAGVTDIYMCFGASITVDKKRHVTAFAPHVDNAKIVHHILLFKSPTPVSAEPFPCSGIGSAVWQLVSGWAPGNTNLELPPEAGFPEEGTTNWVLQVHYNNASGNYEGQTDQSGYELCTTEDLRPNDAGIAAFGTIGISIPPRSKYTMSCTFPAGPNWIGKKFFNAFPHMHGRGTAISTERVPVGGGNPEVIASRDDYDFNSQANQTLSATVKAGDVLRTHCTWKNPSDDTVLFGEKTEDEMCFDFLSFYPAIPDYPWVTPSLSPACVPESSKLE